MEEKLHKILSQWGIASRRQAEAMILAGRVKVNYLPSHIGQKVDPTRDRIEVDGRAVEPQTQPSRLYLLLNKPSGVVTTCSDPWNRPTVLDLLPNVFTQGQGLHPIGRLDADSTGALLLTNDGDLTFHLTHPRYHVPKTYHVWVEGVPSRRTLKCWRDGIVLLGHRTQPAVVNVIAYRKQETCLEIILREGRNRQIRRVAERLGHPVQALHRVAIGSIQLGHLSSGAYRRLSEHEIDGLKHEIDGLKHEIDGLKHETKVAFKKDRPIHSHVSLR